MKVTGANQTTVVVPLERVAALVPVSPSASPTVTPMTTPTTSPSSSPSASPKAGTDQQVIDAIGKLQVGVITWATNNNNLYPTPADVSEAGGIASYVDPWPTNPYTDQPMKPGTQPGDYTYCLLYTSDAADDLLCVDLGGRRIIKTKKTQQQY